MTFLRIFLIIGIVGVGWTQAFLAFGIERPWAWVLAGLVQLVVAFLIPRKAWSK